MIGLIDYMRKAIEFRNTSCCAIFKTYRGPSTLLSKTSYVGNAYGWNTGRICDHFGETPYDFWESV